LDVSDAPALGEPQSTRSWPRSEAGSPDSARRQKFGISLVAKFLFFRPLKTFAIFLFAKDFTNFYLAEMSNFNGLWGEKFGKCIV
jgi:hypothetical protein